MKNNRVNKLKFWWGRVKLRVAGEHVPDVQKGNNEAVDLAGDVCK